MADDDLSIRIGLTEKKYLAQLARMEAQSLKAARSAEKGFERSNAKIARSARKVDSAAAHAASGGLRQISMQLSQVAQQGAVTGNYLQALSVQAADIGLVFGVSGTIVGAMIPILYGVAQGFLETEGDAKKFAAQMEDLTGSVDAFADASKRASESPLDFLKQYKGLADEAQRLFEIEAEIARSRATADLNTTKRNLAGSLGLEDAALVGPEQISRGQEYIFQLQDELVELKRLSEEALDFDPDLQMRIDGVEATITALERIRGGLRDISETFGITQSDAQKLSEMFAALAYVEGPERQANALIEISDHIISASRNLEDATDEGRMLTDQIIQATNSALEFAAADIAANIASGTAEAEVLTEELAQSESLAHSISDGVESIDFSNALAGAQALKEELNITLHQAMKMMRIIGAAAQAARDAAAPPVLDPRDQNYDAAAARRARFEEQQSSGVLNRSLRVPRAGGGSRRRGRSGGGGGLSEEQRAAQREEAEYMREAQRYIDQTKTSLERYNEELAQLAMLNEKGFFEDAPEAYARAVEQLTEELQASEYERFISGVESISDAMAQAIVSGENMGEALANVFRKMAADLLSSGIQELMMQTFGGGIGMGGGSRGGGLFGGLFKGIFGGFRAEGGPVSAGKSYIVGERGPELFSPGVSGMITPNGAGGSSTVQISLGPGLVGNILKQAEGQAVQIASAAGAAQQRQFSGAVQSSQQRGTS